MFLTINNLYSTFGLPTLESNGGIAARESLNGSAIAVYIPIDQKCDQAAQWYGRVCYNLAGRDGDWFDVCFISPGNWDTKEGSCPPGEMCVPIRVRDHDDTRDKDAINCVSRPTQPTVNAPNRQSGVVTVQNAISGASQHIVSVDITSNLPEASVSAVLEGMCHLSSPSLSIYLCYAGSDQNYPIAGNKNIVGTLRGTVLKLCTYNTTYRDCVPTLRYPLRAGFDIIDFTFGLSSKQVVRFYYTISAGGT